MMVESKTNHMTKEMEKASKKFGETFLWDLLIGGLLVSGIFFIIDNVGLDTTGKLVAGIIILVAGICFLIYLFIKRLVIAGTIGKIKDELEPVVLLYKFVSAAIQDADMNADKKLPKHLIKALIDLFGEPMQKFLDSDPDD